MLNPNHLLVFHAVAQAGSVSLGAERLLVSQPAVSKQIKELETRLKTKLFDRHAKGVRPTEAGKTLADYAARIFALCEQAEAAVNDASALRRGHLRLGASTTIGVYLLPQVLVHFRRRFPGVRLELEIESAAVLLRRLKDDALDLGLCERAIDDPDVESAIFTHDEMIAIVPPRHPLTRRRSVTPQTFCAEPFISRETGSDHASLVERALAAKGVSVKPVLSLSSTEAVKQAVAEGLGVAIVSRLAVRNELASRSLAHLPLRGLTIRRPLYQIARRGRQPTKAAVAFLCLLKHALRGTLPRLTTSPSLPPQTASIKSETGYRSHPPNGGKGSVGVRT